MKMRHGKLCAITPISTYNYNYFLHIVQGEKKCPSGCMDRIPLFKCVYVDTCRGACSLVYAKIARVLLGINGRHTSSQQMREMMQAEASDATQAFTSFISGLGEHV